MLTDEHGLLRPLQLLLLQTPLVFRTHSLTSAVQGMAMLWTMLFCGAEIHVTRFLCQCMCCRTNYKLLFFASFTRKRLRSSSGEFDVECIMASAAHFQGICGLDSTGIWLGLPM
ncbi:hypothetical protein DUNSADRAFT_4154 [Dunaliella salina]|uniref:Secreted protein n=1 Tax=Dunaliella salina TaxID=3046 RepID=A0ABQ7GSQ1_DUNSA|nr:hypothetical protein DUNSADRAFT_4154 [Dunaliella salina]|eukprot:KAF5837583.1 hypothetical protein DUNSADRAFT_4154 [Dunaliella salina]